MMDMREPKDRKEGRRLRAYELKQAGWSQDQIAEALGVSKGAVSKWLARARAGGVAGLLRRPAPGAASRLSAEQLDSLPGVLAKGACRLFGFLVNHGMSKSTKYW